MTKQEWMQCIEPEPMLEYLHGKVLNRKLRLFACACCRRIWHQLSAESRNLIDVLERREAGRAKNAECSIAFKRNYAFIRGATPHSAIASAAGAVSAAAGGGAWAAAWNTVSEARRAVGRIDPSQVNTEGRMQAVLLREIIHHPMRTCPSLRPAILVWNDGTIHRLAQTIYDNQTFDLLPILADALEEAGCDNEEIFTHCRQPGGHVRGCWPVDLILGRQ